MGNRKAFTTIELVIVITVLGVLAVAIFVNGTPKGAVILQAASQKLSVDLKYLQQMAITEQVRFGISFDTQDNSYFGYRINTSVKATDPQTQNDMDIDFDEIREFRGIGISATNLTGDAIEFDSAGSPYDGFGIKLSNKGTITLTEGINTKIVNIEAETGKVSLE